MDADSHNRGQMEIDTREGLGGENFLLSPPANMVDSCIQMMCIRSQISDTIGFKAKFREKWRVCIEIEGEAGPELERTFSILGSRFGLHIEWSMRIKQDIEHENE